MFNFYLHLLPFLLFILAFFIASPEARVKPSAKQEAAIDKCLADKNIPLPVKAKTNSMDEETRKRAEAVVECVSGGMNNVVCCRKKRVAL